MTSYWDLSREEQNKIDVLGIDYDLRACLEYNPQSFTIFDIEKVMAVFEGEKDSENWRWVLKLTAKSAKENGGRYAYLEGGCDYTGWDCQSYADSRFAKTALKAAEYSKSKEFSGYKDYTFLIGVYTKLVEQIKSKKSQTWRELKDAELNIKDVKKIP